MLQRQVEPELMNATDQVEAYAAADFSQSDQALVAWIAQRFPMGLGDRVIDLGCGPGNIALLLVQRWQQIEVVGIDGAPKMLALAAARGQSLGRSSQALALATGLFARLLTPGWLLRSSEQQPVAPFA